MFNYSESLNVHPVVLLENSPILKLLPCIEFSGWSPICYLFLKKNQLVHYPIS